MLAAATMNNEAPQQCQNYSIQQQLCSSPALSPSFAVFGHHSRHSGLEKRSRGQEYNQSQHQHQYLHQQTANDHSNEALNYSTPATHEAPLPESSSKRSKPNNYEAPRTVRPSLLTAMGSLVGGSTAPTVRVTVATHGPPFAVIHHRRQLSGGAIEHFIGGHDNMDTDTNDHSRPRSMSF